MAKQKPKYIVHVIITANIKGSQTENSRLKKGKESVQAMIGFSLHLTGREGGASFLDQSQSKVEQTLLNQILDHFHRLKDLNI